MCRPSASSPVEARLRCPCTSACGGRRRNASWSSRPQRWKAAGAPTAPLQALVGKVKSGDPEEHRGQGRGVTGVVERRRVRRDQDGDGINALLNYGYTILRSATARAVVAAGLHPSIGLHHSNDANAMRLVDDLMEPFPARWWI